MRRSGEEGKGKGWRSVEGVPEYVLQLLGLLAGRLVGSAVVQEGPGIGHGAGVHLRTAAGASGFSRTSAQVYTLG